MPKNRDSLIHPLQGFRDVLLSAAVHSQMVELGRTVQSLLYLLQFCEPHKTSAMAVNVVSRARLGVSFAMVSMLTISGGALLMYNGLLGRNPHFVWGALCAIGFVVWFAGQVGPRKELSAENPLACVGTARRWGTLLIISACLIYTLSAYRRHHSKPPPEPAKPVLQEAAAPPPVQFPPLRLQSIIFQGAKSTALINGKVLGVGEEVELVQVVDIKPDHVVVTLQGATNVLALGDVAKTH